MVRCRHRCRGRRASRPEGRYPAARAQRARDSQAEGSPSPDSVKLKTYGDVIADYKRHPEPKSLDPSGAVCGRGSTGLLQRRPIHAVLYVFIGKQSNNLDDQQARLIHKLNEAFAIYRDPRQDVWTNLALPVLRDFPAAEIAARSGLHRRTVERHLSGRSQPHRRNEVLLVAAAVELAGAFLSEWDPPAPRDPLACLVAYLEALTTQSR
jgi:hypothetical protein